MAKFFHDIDLNYNEILSFEKITYKRIFNRIYQYLFNIGRKLVNLKIISTTIQIMPTKHFDKFVIVNNETSILVKHINKYRTISNEMIVLIKYFNEIKFFLMKHHC